MIYSFMNQYLKTKFLYELIFSELYVLIIDFSFNVI